MTMITMKLFTNTKTESMNKDDKPYGFPEITTEYAQSLFDKLFDRGHRMSKNDYDIVKTDIRKFVSEYAAHKSVEFAKWLHKNKWEYSTEIHWYSDASEQYNTTERLYEIYLKEKGI